MRWSDGEPLLQNLTSYWMLRQWDWRRHPFNGHLHGPHAAAVLRGEEPT